MSLRNKVSAALLASAVTAALGSAAFAAPLTKAEESAAQAAGKQKCYGVALKAQNDCGRRPRHHLPRHLDRRLSGKFLEVRAAWDLHDAGSAGGRHGSPAPLTRDLASR